MATNQVDNLLTRIGTGKWNIIHAVAAGIGSGLPAAHALGGVFVVPRLHHICRMNDATGDEVSTNSSEVNQCIYLEKTDDGTMQEVSCTEWDFDNSTFTNTMTSEFGLVCDQDYIRVMYMSLYMIGVLVASPTAGYISDRFGRRKPFMIGGIAFVCLSLISPWLPNISAILACRFLIGLTHVPIVKISYILGMETCSPTSRSACGILMYFPWTIYAIIFSGMGYFLRDWRHLMTAASIPSILLLPLLMMIDESPHWLTVRGQYSQALQVLKKAANWNRVHLPKDEAVMTMLKLTAVKPTENETEGRESFCSRLQKSVKDLFILFRTPRLRIISLVMNLNFFVIDMVYYGLSFSGGNFEFDIFFYMVLLGLTEIPCRTLLVPIVNRFGRKVPLVSTLIVSGVILVCIAFVPNDLLWLTMTFALLGRMIICLASAVTYVYESELFPTEVRTRGISFTFMMSRVGSSIAPFITEYLGHTYRWGPSAAFGGFAIAAGLASIALWDTSDLPFPDTIHFLENNDPRDLARAISRAKRSRRKDQNGLQAHSEEMIQLNTNA